MTVTLKQFSILHTKNVLNKGNFIGYMWYVVSFEWFWFYCRKISFNFLIWEGYFFFLLLYFIKTFKRYHNSILNGIQYFFFQQQIYLVIIWIDAVKTVWWNQSSVLYLWMERTDLQSRDKRKLFCIRHEFSIKESS